jgi:hypothetical protein
MYNIQPIKFDRMFTKARQKSEAIRLEGEAAFLP